jgi:hypothetical protein
MPRITKGMIAAAQSELACIHELAIDPHALGGCYAYHSLSANRYLELLHKAGLSLPAWCERNRKHLEYQGWRFPYGARFELRS